MGEDIDICKEKSLSYSVPTQKFDFPPLRYLLWNFLPSINQHVDCPCFFFSENEHCIKRTSYCVLSPCSAAKRKFFVHLYSVRFEDAHDKAKPYHDEVEHVSIVNEFLNWGRRGLGDYLKY